LQGAIDSLINTKPDRSSSALEGSLTGVDFRVVSEEELDRLRAGPNPLITGSLKYHVTSGRVYVRQEEVGPIPRALSSSTREALIFIHGYNCSLEFGLCKLGQLYALGR
jgi:esterase/lipase superfamily enzyme